MEPHQLIFHPTSDKIKITLYENPAEKNDDGTFFFDMPSPVRVIAEIPVGLPKNAISIALGVSEDPIR